MYTKYALVDVKVCEQVLNTYVLPQCKGIVKFECTLSTAYEDATILIKMIRYIDGYFDDVEYDIFRGYLSMLGIGFTDYILNWPTI